MSTTADYLNALKAQKDQLVDNLNAKAVECSKSELFNSLIAKINTIYDTGGLAYGEWLVPGNTDTFTVSGLNALPTSFGISCEQVITDSIIELGKIFVAAFWYDSTKQQVTFYKYIDDSTFVYDAVSTDLICNITQEANGTYSITVSFTEFNEMTTKPYLFKGGYEYNWVASSKEWFL